MEAQNFSCKFGGKTLTLSTGLMAERATSAVTVTYGDTVVLATVVVATEPREGVDFLPLMVDYEERMYAAGKISGSRFIKREGRPSETAVLNARLIDRSLRPLFPKGYYNDVQVIITVLSVDGENDPDILAIIGASAALMLTPAPFEGPVAGVRVSMLDGKLMTNPTMAQQEQSELNLVIAATRDRVMMIEAGAKEISEKKVLEAIKVGQKELEPVMKLMEKMAAKVKPKLELPEFELTQNEILDEITKFLGQKLSEAVREHNKEKREAMLAEFEANVLANFEGQYKQVDLKTAFGQLVQKHVRELILEDGIRPDGRAVDEIRPLIMQVGLLPRTHGSALFARGQTQVLSIVTLGGPGEEQMIDTMEREGEKRFMHHYNFPPFSVGEIKPMRPPGRREIGHGALVERGVEAVIPDKDQFPYTIRVVSEVLSSNGSSSMASTCGTVLALMDAGVPIKAPVAGIAIGLVSAPDFDTNPKAKYQLLTDIQGIEDFGGDMDFKVAGTQKGITAIQLDMKVKGLPDSVIEEAFARAKKARLDILKQMAQLLPAPRANLSPYAPRIITVQIPVEKIGTVIGPGGKTINEIIEQAGGKQVTTINIDEDGLVAITSHDALLAAKAKQTIEGLVQEAKVGQIYEGKVIAIQKSRESGKEIGAIVEILPGKEGMVHISEVAFEHIPDVSSRIQVGDTVKVKVLSIDEERGRIALSIKQAQQQ